MIMRLKEMKGCRWDCWEWLNLNMGWIMWMEKIQVMNLNTGWIMWMGKFQVKIIKAKKIYNWIPFILHA